MSKFLISFLFVLVYASASAGIKIVSVKGDVAVRHNVQEEWTTLSRGDVLQAEDAIKSGKKSSITFLVDGVKKIVVPELVVLDLSDIRSLTQEELLLKLAMEGVRSAPPNPQNENDLTIPQTTTMHGWEYAGEEDDPPIDPGFGMLELNGVRVLYQNGFYATCVLRAEQLFRLNALLRDRVDSRLLVASAFEKVSLRGEALREYRAIQKMNLPPAKQALVDSKVRQLQKEKSK